MRASDSGGLPCSDDRSLWKSGFCVPFVIPLVTERRVLMLFWEVNAGYWVIIFALVAWVLGIWIAPNLIQRCSYSSSADCRVDEHALLEFATNRDRNIDHQYLIWPAWQTFFPTNINVSWLCHTVPYAVRHMTCCWVALCRCTRLFDVNAGWPICGVADSWMPVLVLAVTCEQPICFRLTQLSHWPECHVIYVYIVIQAVNARQSTVTQTPWGEFKALFHINEFYICLSPTAE